MLVISPYAQLRVTIRSEQINYTPKGDEASRDRQLFAQFIPATSLPAWAKALALETFQNRITGLPEGVQPLERVGWFDTDHMRRDYGWSDAEKALIEEKLRTLPGSGVNWLILERPRLAPPWPRYDSLVVHGRRTVEHVVEAITSTVTETGVDAAEVVAYERQNRDRPEVIAALEALTPEPDPDEELVVA